MEVKLLKTKIFGMDFWYREDDRYIGQRIALGKYEEYETMLMQHQLKDVEVVVDVGANIGYYTLLMASMAKRVYALEPDKECFEILKKNVEENNLKNVVILNVAAGAKKEIKNLIKDIENMGNSHLGDEKGVEVKCERLEQILINEHKIDLIKIDTQGWEPAVIVGAKKIIERDKPTLFLEYSPAEYKDEKMKEYLKNIYKHIWSIDYWFYVCRNGIRINKKTGYTDLWIKDKVTIGDYWWAIKEIRIKKVLKSLMKYY
ncbi:FkbM family methyltransferase [Candidatus Shapirobacteria bacterium]|nr:FkbM family methyltransferase [Candidatus Shapirobacteria bacterium]